jgi:rod shape-determining protein MreC
VSLRDGPFQDLKVPLTWTAAVAVIVAAVIGGALLLGDRRETLQSQAHGVSKSFADTVAKPVGAVLAAPVRWSDDAVDSVRGYFFAVSENRRLKVEVIALRQSHDRMVALENLNGRYRALLGLKTDPPVPMVAAHIVTDSRGPFANTRLADAGDEQGVAIGNPVMSEQGLVGRVIGVAHGVSRVLLLTDLASRTPVMDDRTNARAILTGDGGPNPKLAYMRGMDPAKEGDRVLTSGDGGLFPRGLPVGVAVRGYDGLWRVRLDSDSAPIDYVKILQFKDFSQLADQKALAASVVPPLSPAEAAAVAAKAAPPPPPAAAIAQPAPAAALSGGPHAAASVPPAPAPSAAPQQ